MSYKEFVISMSFLLMGPAYTMAQMDSLNLDEVVVTGTRYDSDIRHLPNTVTVIGRQRLTQNYQTSVLPTLMQDVPGLMVTSRSMLGYGVSTGAAGGINLRGLAGSSGQLLVLIDGHPQYNGIYGHPISDSYQTMMAERVEVLRGPASVLYGSNAMGGVINIVTRKADTDGNNLQLNLGAGSYGTVETELSDLYRHGKFHINSSLQFSRSDNHRPHMGFYQYGGNVKMGYNLSNHWDLSADIDLTHFKSEYPGSTTSPIYGADQWITRGAVMASVDNHYDKTNGSVSIFSNFGRHKIDDGSRDQATPSDRYFRSRDNVAGISWWQSFQLMRGNHLTLGVDYQHIYGRAFYTSKSTGETLQTTNKISGHSHRNEVGAYADFRQDISTWLTVDAGLRWDHHSVSGTEWVPQAGIVFRPNSTGEIKLMASKGFRNPTMRELYLYPTSTEELKPERMWNYELSWHDRLMNGSLTYGINIFYINGDNMIQVVERKNVNTGKIENSGVEVEASYAINSHWRVSTNHSVLHMVHHVVSAPEYKGFVGADCSYGRWNANAGLQIVSGLFKSVGTNESTENFCLLNSTVSYKAMKNLKLWVRGENLLAQKYEIIAGYPMPRATFMAGLQLNI